jgi:hypothetical protein
MDIIYQQANIYRGLRIVNRAAVGHPPDRPRSDWRGWGNVAGRNGTATWSKGVRGGRREPLVALRSSRTHFSPPLPRTHPCAIPT